MIIGLFWWRSCINIFFMSLYNIIMKVPSIPDQGSHPHQVECVIVIIYDCYQIIHFDKLVSVPMFCFLIYNWRTTEGLNYVKNEPKILFLALAQRAAGGWSPSKTILDRGTTTSRIFSDLDVFNTKVNDFLGKIQVISCLSRYQPIILTNCLSSGKVWMYYFLICVIIWYRYEWHECFIFVFFHGTNHLFW